MNQIKVIYNKSDAENELLFRATTGKKNIKKLHLCEALFNTAVVFLFILVIVIGILCGIWQFDSSGDIFRELPIAVFSGFGMFIISGIPVSIIVDKLDDKLTVMQKKYSLSDNAMYYNLLNKYKYTDKDISENIEIECGKIIVNKDNKAFSELKFKEDYEIITLENKGEHNTLDLANKKIFICQ